MPFSRPAESVSPRHATVGYTDSAHRQARTSFLLPPCAALQRWPSSVPTHDTVTVPCAPATSSAEAAALRCLRRCAAGWLYIAAPRREERPPEGRAAAAAAERQQGRPRQRACPFCGALRSCTAVTDARRHGRCVARVQSGFTPLHFSAACGHVELTRLLLERGAGIDARTKVRTCCKACWVCTTRAFRRARC